MSKGRKETMLFISKIEEIRSLIEDCSYLIDYQGNKYDSKEYLARIILDARELLEVNEWMIALENTLINLDEVNFKLQKEILDPVVNFLYSLDRISYINLVKDIYLNEE